MRIVLLLALMATAAAQYTQAQSQSFLQMKADVLAAVAPSIDPINKLAARVSLTFANSTGIALPDSNQAIIDAMRDIAIYSIVSTEVVAFFQAYSKDAANLVTLVATWADVPESYVLVVVNDTPSNQLSMQQRQEGNMYNVTVMANIDTRAVEKNPWNVVDKVWTDLLPNLPSRDKNYNCAVCGSTCTCANICYYQLLPEFIDYAYNPNGRNCNSSFIGGQVGLRYTIDLFSNYDVPNSQVANDMAHIWAASTSVWPNLPNTTLQFTVPMPEHEPGPLKLSATVFASSGISVAVIGVVVVMLYRRS